MKAAIKRARDTQRVYAFELCLAGPSRPMRVLRALARRIWAAETPRRERCPVVVAGRGLRLGVRLASYCEGRCRIVLTRNQRDRVTLIHELVHALGFETHGERFQRRYAELLGRYYK